ncbi:MAG: purine-nucleoside phosphorylase [Cryobacterium sp.]|nr:purine-nucleoside phosphorylase [Oligoflexia bacterium]
MHDQILEAVSAIKYRVGGSQPEIGIVLGSGLGLIIEQILDPVTIPYSEIPSFHGTSAEGNAGKMIFGKFHGVMCAFLVGRFHVYEGYPMSEVVFPVRTLCALGIKTLLLTNASGGINTRFRPGDLMLIEDHLNLMGDNPLKGPNLNELGPRFPDMTEAYSKDCRSVFEAAAVEIGIDLKRGVYAGVLGPTYETPAEIRMLRILGADAVGMSTVPEAIAANHLGVRVAGIACITNLASGLSARRLRHTEVVENVKLSARQLARLLEKAIPQLVYRKK